jgi:hypothetical protein
LLETQKRVGEAAEAIELRQRGENSVLGSLAMSVGMSLTQVMRWAYWWNSTEAWPDDVTVTKGFGFEVSGQRSGQKSGGSIRRVTGDGGRGNEEGRSLPSDVEGRSFMSLDRFLCWL